MINRERYDIVVYRRDTWDGLIITISKNGNPIDLTGCAITMQVKVNPTDTSSVLTLSTVNNEITITEPTNGKFRINATVINLDSGTYYYDIQFNFSPTLIKTYMFGTFDVTQDITVLN